MADADLNKDVLVSIPERVWGGLEPMTVFALATSTGRFNP